VGALIEAFDGTGKRMVVATATGVLGDTGPEPVADDFAGQPDFPARIRMGVEDDVRQASRRGVRGVVVRPAILLHGHGAGQFVPMLVAAARASGVAGYPGAGTNRLASVHDDVTPGRQEVLRAPQAQRVHRAGRGLHDVARGAPV